MSFYIAWYQATLTNLIDMTLPVSIQDFRPWEVKLIDKW